MGFSSVIYIIIRLIKNPISTIKSIDLINYDRDYLFKFIVSISIILGYQLSVLILNINNIGVLIFIPIIAPLFISIINNLTVLLYFIIFKFGGIEIKASYDNIKILLYPIILVRLIWSVLFNIIVWLMPVLAEILKLGIEVWFGYMIFLILIYKFEQNVVRSTILSIVPVLITFINIVT